jgi:hypothetical protein
MRMRTITMLAFGTAGALLLAGCTADDPAAPRVPAAAGPTASTSPSPTGPPDKDVLVAALTKVHAAPFRFTVSGNLPDDAAVEASGVFDPPGQLYDATITLTGKNAGKQQRIAIGKDNYLRRGNEKTFVHLDMSRVKKDNSLLYFDLADATGLVKFVSTIRSAQRTGPTTFTGRFDPFVAGDEFLPIGAPSLWTLGAGTQPFTATTDEQGQVVSVQVEFAPSEGQKLVMTTTFADHGRPSGVKAPARGNVQEAADLYYD